VKKKNPLRTVPILPLIAAAIILLVRHFHNIKGLQIVGQEVLYASGQPMGLDYTQLLYNYYIATIVNIRSSIEHRDRNWYNEEIIWTRNNWVK
jgi:hypothetical protein